MSRSREYIAVKNFIHNEMKLSKEDFKGLLIDAIKEEAKSYVKREMQRNPQNYIEESIKYQVGDAIKRLFGSGSYSNSSRIFMESLGKNISKQITVTVNNENNE